MSVLSFCHQVQAVCSGAYLETTQEHAKYYIKVFVIQLSESFILPSPVQNHCHSVVRIFHFAIPSAELQVRIFSVHNAVL